VCRLSFYLHFTKTPNERRHKFFISAGGLLNLCHDTLIFIHIRSVLSWLFGLCDIYFKDRFGVDLLNTDLGRNCQGSFET
jgi:hypothetical protein